MNPLNVFVKNYKQATEGFNLAGKIFLTIVLLFIFTAILFALVGVLMDAAW